MLKIRLRRMGAIRQPHYRIVVADARAPRDGAFIDLLGHYNPRTDPATIQIDTAKYDEWKRKGAQPTDAVERLIRQFGRQARKAAATTEVSQPTSRRTRTASGKGVSRPQAVAEAPTAQVEAGTEAEAEAEAVTPEAEAEAVTPAPVESAADETAKAPVLEAAAELPAGAAEGATDTDTAV